MSTICMFGTCQQCGLVQYRQGPCRDCGGSVQSGGMKPAPEEVAHDGGNHQKGSGSTIVRKCIGDGGGEMVEIPCGSLDTTQPACKTCGGTRLVDDGELTHSAGGIAYENGPIKCVKDCPDCTPAEGDHDGRQLEWERAENQQLKQEINTLRIKLERLKKRAWAVMQEALDSAEVHPCDEHSEDVKVKTLAPVYQDLYASLTDTTVVAVDPGQPGGDMTATATLSYENGRMLLHGIEHSELADQWSPEKLADIPHGGEPLTFNTINEPPCSFCFQRGCNGECSGDGTMGGD